MDWRPLKSEPTPVFRPGWLKIRNAPPPLPLRFSTHSYYKETLPLKQHFYVFFWMDHLFCCCLTSDQDTFSSLIFSFKKCTFCCLQCTQLGRARACKSRPVHVWPFYRIHMWTIDYNSGNLPDRLWSRSPIRLKLRRVHHCTGWIILWLCDT